MKKYLAILLSAVQFLALVSCSETEEFDDHADWKNRNRAFIESMADSCDTYISKGVDVTNATAGQMFRLTSFKLDPSKEWGRSSGYIYCRVIAKGDGTESPYITDSVRINYRARLIPTVNYPEGEIVDHSYRTDRLDPAVNVPSSFQVNGLVDGVVTALLYMHTGDHWILYIPQEMAYGSNSKNSIPKHSALMFEINLTQFARIGNNLPPR